MSKVVLTNMGDAAVDIKIYGKERVTILDSDGSQVQLPDIEITVLPPGESIELDADTYLVKVLEHVEGSGLGDPHASGSGD